MPDCPSSTPRLDTHPTELRHESDSARSLSDAHVYGLERALAEATRCPRPPGPLPDPTLDRAFLAACVALERERRAAMTHAVAALVVRMPAPGGGTRVEKKLHVFAPGDALPAAFVLGSHAECDVARIPGASLRHAALIAMPPGPGEAPELEAIDLHTSAGLTSAQGGVCHSFHAKRALLCGVGTAEVLWVSAPAGTQLFLHSVAQTVARGAEAEAGELPRAKQPAANTRAADAPLPAVEQCFRERILNVSRVLCAAETRPANARRPSALFIETDWDALARGVLLGRYARCEGHQALATHAGVSRVHALLVVRKQCMWVIDTGSTNGTAIRDSAGGRVELNARRRPGLLRDTDELWLHTTRVWVGLH